MIYYINSEEGLTSWGWAEDTAAQCTVNLSLGRSDTPDHTSPEDPAAQSRAWGWRVAAGYVIDLFHPSAPHLIHSRTQWFTSVVQIITCCHSSRGSFIFMLIFKSLKYDIFYSHGVEDQILNLIQYNVFTWMRMDPLCVFIYHIIDYLS